ncbi:MAG: succinate dehydrogenase, hydrophobic membrane anchor protein [Dongiaceae bacterium]
MRGLRSDLGRVRGLGSAKEGVQHWWLQRVTAVALVPLLVWFLIGLIAHSDADHQTVTAWLGSPVTFGLFLLLLGAGLWHLALGLQVVIEDYVLGEGMRLALILLVKFGCIVLALTGAIALASIAFGN